MQYKNKRYLIFLILLLSVAGILFFGLNNKNFIIDNDATWLTSPQSIEFHGNGLAYTQKFSLSDPAGRDDGATFALLLAPAEASSNRGFQFIASITSGDPQTQFVIAQWRQQLIVMSGDNYDYSRRLPRLTTEIRVDDGQFLLLAVRLSPLSSELFVNGVRAARLNAAVSLPHGEAELRLLLGDSIQLNNAWTGRIAGVALFQQSLSDSELADAWQHWLDRQQFVLAAPKSAKIYFDFAGDVGREVVDLSGEGNGLLLPEFRRPLQPRFARLQLEPSSITDMLINIFGFMPFGFLLAWALAFRSSKIEYGSVVTVVLASAVLSGSIELSQAWLPNRFSSLMDLILNIVGGACGAIGYRFSHKWSNRLAQAVS